jgi:hypothetical protein
MSIQEAIKKAIEGGYYRFINGKGADNKTLRQLVSVQYDMNEEVNINAYSSIEKHCQCDPIKQRRAIIQDILDDIANTNEDVWTGSEIREYLEKELKK